MFGICSAVARGNLNVRCEQIDCGRDSGKVEGGGGLLRGFGSALARGHCRGKAEGIVV